MRQDFFVHLCVWRRRLTGCAGCRHQRNAHSQSQYHAVFYIHFQSGLGSVFIFPIVSQSLQKCKGKVRPSLLSGVDFLSQLGHITPIMSQKRSKSSSPSDSGSNSTSQGEFDPLAFSQQMGEILEKLQPLFTRYAGTHLSGCAGQCRRSRLRC